MYDDRRDSFLDDGRSWDDDSRLQLIPVINRNVFPVTVLLEVNFSGVFESILQLRSGAFLRRKSCLFHMLNLGGTVIGFSSAQNSSVAKGESVSDTVRTVSCYADIIAMRHPKEGAPMVAAEKSTIPIINAGDGGHQHPTQTLTDLLTIRSLRGRLDHLTYGLCGDLKFGRTVHSLIQALIRYDGVRFILISPEELRLPSYTRHNVLDKFNVPYEEVVRLEDAIPKLDILYMTRVQKERFFNEDDYLRMRSTFDFTGAS